MDMKTDYGAACGDFAMALRQAEYERRLMERPARDVEQWTTQYRWVSGYEPGPEMKRMFAEKLGWYTVVERKRNELAEVLWTVS